MVQEGEANPTRINVEVMDEYCGRGGCYQMRPTTPFAKINRAYHVHRRTKLACTFPADFDEDFSIVRCNLSFKFEFNGKLILDSDTPKGLGMEEGDTIYYFCGHMESPMISLA